MALRAVASSWLVGMTLLGNGVLVRGLMMSTHFAEPGFVVQKAEVVGKTPVPALSSARFPASWAAEG